LTNGRANVCGAANIAQGLKPLRFFVRRIGPAEAVPLLQDLRVEVRAIPHLKGEMWGTRHPARNCTAADAKRRCCRGKNLFVGDSERVFAG
jgi:hypothetical protein